MTTVNRRDFLKFFASGFACLASAPVLSACNAGPRLADTTWYHITAEPSESIIGDTPIVHYEYSTIKFGSGKSFNTTYGRESDNSGGSIDDYDFEGMDVTYDETGTWELEDDVVGLNYYGVLTLPVVVSQEGGTTLEVPDNSCGLSSGTFYPSLEEAKAAARAELTTD